LCGAQSYSCGGATAPGNPTLSNYSCTIPFAPFSQTGTFTTYCYSEPVFGGATQYKGGGSINASGTGTCGVMGQQCAPNFEAIVSDNGATVTAWAYNVVSPVGCLHGSGQDGSSFTCSATCNECKLNVDACPCTTGYSCSSGCCLPASGCDCTGQTPKCCPNGVCVALGAQCNISPIVLDALDEGFHLTSLSHVQFRVLPGGPLTQMSWTDANWHNG
jgi:hypothetical protein